MSFRRMDLVALPDTARGFVDAHIGDEGSLSCLLVQQAARWKSFGILPPGTEAERAGEYEGGALFGLPEARLDWEPIESGDACAALVAYLRDLARISPGWLIAEALWMKASDFGSRDIELGGYVVEPTFYLPISSERILHDPEFSPAKFSVSLYSWFAYIPCSNSEELDLSDLSTLARRATRRIVCAYDFESYIIEERVP